MNQHKAVVMITDRVSSVIKAATFPIEIHIFEHQGCHFAFDVRNFTILKLNSHGAAVLSRMRDLPLSDIAGELGPEVPAHAIRAHYLKFLELIRDGVLSVEPVPGPERPPFNRLVLMLAGGCNMGCLYCFEKDKPTYQKPNLMTREIADEILDWFFRHQEGKKAHIQLYGGEPLLNWPVLQHVVGRTGTWAQENGIEMTKYLITNGTLLNPQRIAYLKSHNVRIQVSVDGDTHTHNRFRVFKSGEPTMEWITPNIHELSRQGADFNLRAVLTRQNKAPDLVINGLRSLGAEKVSFEVVATEFPEARLTNEDWEVFNENYRNFVYSPYINWRRLPDEMQSMIIRICERRRVFYGCGAGINEVTVAPDGSIYECQRMYRDPYSNISEDKSPTGLNSQFLTLVDERPVCKECWVRYVCGGGCMHQSHSSLGSQEPVPQFCMMKRNLAEASIVKVHEIRLLNEMVAGRTNDEKKNCTTEP